MDEKMFASFIKQRLPRDDDRKLFEKLLEIFSTNGKEALAQYLKEKIIELEG